MTCKGIGLLLSIAGILGIFGARKETVCGRVSLFIYWANQILWLLFWVLFVGYMFFYQTEWKAAFKEESRRFWLGLTLIDQESVHQLEEELSCC